MTNGPQSAYLRMVGRISFFSAISYAVDYSFQLIDMFWVAQLGTTAPTSITLVSVIIFVVLGLNEIVGVSTVSLLSQSVGRGEDAKTGALILNCLVVKFCLGVAMVALFASGLALTIWLQDLSGRLKVMTVEYAWIIWPSLVLIPEPFAKLSKVDDFIPQKRVISGGFNPRHGHLTDVCWKSKTTTSRVRKKVNHAHYKSYTR